VHKLSPITNEARLRTALDYVAEQSLALAREVLGQDLAIDTLCFFTHSPEEYAFLEQAVRARGPKSRLSHGPTLYTDVDFAVHDQRIRIFGVRQPDPTRPQVGYGDYPVPDYERFLALVSDNPHMHEITSGRGKSLIELRHPDFDVLGFIVNQAEHLT